VVFVLVVDLALQFAGDLVDLSKFTVIRLLRFARLTKLVRVLRLRAFKELRLLVNGVFAGIRTLAWALVFLVFFVYCLGVLLRQTVGTEPASPVCDASEDSCSLSQDHMNKYRPQLFGSVPHSMLTAFRCFTDGCSSVDGTPLMVHLLQVYGTWLVSIYVLCTVFVTFGLFNLIMAIFVESTREVARHDDRRSREARREADIRAAQQLQHLITLIMAEERGKPVHKEGAVHHALSRALSWVPTSLELSSTSPETVATAANVTLTLQDFQSVLTRPNVESMLLDLDIHVGDAWQLFEVLDADSNGVLSVQELVKGFMMLRGGQAEKSDFVASVLASKAIHQSMKSLESMAHEVSQDIEARQHTMEAVLASIDGRLQQLAGPEPQKSPARPVMRAL